ncbi:hypothetical protein OSB04_015855 [Centaurea solstitialis]|uniref:Integrase zinc-binding domain-containing protein n=1 Tax=Centaurea solstitialis TaxID=347529 RepID=A0AA38WGX1_9ASTR|nr:hypothetical protein OSB04_015855 [Centaurea solstitialis]
MCKSYMKLNLSKYSFIRTSKFLGYTIVRRGIEANPNQSHDRVAENLIKVQKLVKRITSLNRISLDGRSRTYDVTSFAVQTTRQDPAVIFGHHFKYNKCRLGMTTRCTTSSKLLYNTTWMTYQPTQERSIYLSRFDIEYKLRTTVIYYKTHLMMRDEQMNQILQELHDGKRGNHLRGRSLANRISRQGYYWPTLREDAIRDVMLANGIQVRHINPLNPYNPY